MQRMILFVNVHPTNIDRAKQLDWLRFHTISVPRGI